MTLNIKTSEIGWFYHAPARKKNTEPVIPPPLSQIPGLSNLSDQPEEEPSQRMWIKESDSKYIRLAKQGGRPNLLSMSTPEPQSSEPVGYPRVDWYYDDTTSVDSQQDDEIKEPHQFMLPDYMVHRPFRPKPAAGGNSCSSSYSSQQPRVGSSATEKTQKLPEQRKLGYGVRQEKQQAKDSRRRSTEPDKLHQPAHGHTKVAEETDDVMMKKLMSHGYTDTYNVQRKNWHQQHPDGVAPTEDFKHD